MIDAPLATMNEHQAEVFEQAAAVARNELGPRMARQQRVALRNLDIIIDKAARHALELRQTWHAIWKDLEETTVGDDELRLTGERLRAGYQRWSRVLANLRKDCEQLASAGHSLTSVPVLELAMVEVARLQEALENNWPWPDRPLPAMSSKLIEDSRAAAARGDVQHIEDLTRELESRVRPAG